MAILFKAEKRTAGTRGELKKMRQRGIIPGVVYGTKLNNPVNISVNEKELMALLRSHPHALLDMDVPGVGKQPVMMTEVQRDSLSRSVLHIDFHQINMNEAVKTSVRIEMTGDSQGVREGGILQAMLHEIEVLCLPGKIPDVIEVDVTKLQIGENVLVGDLALPEGVTTRLEPEQVVVTILAPQKELTEDEAADQAVKAAEAAERAEEGRLEVHTDI
ncbi:50S ribosomal protein L25 [Paenibacillus baekrokdamisoli]|uniref:Large ribosomal subunit protein bL25 n=2 Tax=Paenibacillus baekrokdamisoli TaxID=1712516 RepID=A0A3G9JH26_9BACL|nr:50S ribosomal protein L25 [Paenibacillus baekrokdamisoli]MBB3072982.1 large subunit ribosomal protein L25 [Paenibacillus baekrokdamisoli]BBH23348.1 50S ribosomal protein L25 [Paenibacillus baekrokdamisoli]